MRNGKNINEPTYALIWKAALNIRPEQYEWSFFLMSGNQYRCITDLCQWIKCISFRGAHITVVDGLMQWNPSFFLARQEIKKWQWLTYEHFVLIHVITSHICHWMTDMYQWKTCVGFIDSLKQAHAIWTVVLSVVRESMNDRHVPMNEMRQFQTLFVHIYM